MRIASKQNKGLVGFGFALCQTHHHLPLGQRLTLLERISELLLQALVLCPILFTQVISKFLFQDTISITLGSLGSPLIRRRHFNNARLLDRPYFCFQATFGFVVVTIFLIQFFRRDIDLVVGTLITPMTPACHVSHHREEAVVVFL